MPVKRVTPAEAAKLATEGYTLVDVRSIPEFDDGHPTGARNIPFMHLEPGRGMTPNAAFGEVFSKHFAKDAKVVVSCKTGGRSLRAAEMLATGGFTNVIDMRGGWEGERDASGQVACAGWKESKLPIEKPAPVEHTYEALKK